MHSCIMLALPLSVLFIMITMILAAVVVAPYTALREELTSEGKGILEGGQEGGQELKYMYAILEQSMYSKKKNNNNKK